MRRITTHGNVSKAAMAAGIDRGTAAKYRKLGKMPSEVKADRPARGWRTRQDVFRQDWPGIVAMLEDAPELQAKTIFEKLMEDHPGRYQEGQLRTLQRLIRRWRAQKGPPKEVFFPQCHVPGEAAQTDFTWGDCLDIKIQGESFKHKICHVCLPYSNWEWVTVCQSESMIAIQRGVQAALVQLGAVPRYHQTDNSTAATHNLATGKREFNDDYLALVRHFGMKPRTTGIGKKEQNGDIEAANGVFKRRANQYLLLRGSRDFPDVQTYEAWLQGIAEKANDNRSERVKEEMKVMSQLTAARLPEYSELRVRVTRNATIRVKGNTYSVPSRLIGERVTVRLFDDRLEVVHAGAHQLTTDRLVGKARHRIQYRHVIDSLVRKPGAMARYRYRDDLFPSLAFRRAHELLREALATTTTADLEYLRILHLAATTMEADVEAALQILIEEGVRPTIEAVRDLVEIGTEPLATPGLEPFIVDLAGFDALISEPEIEEVTA